MFCPISSNKWHRMRTTVAFAMPAPHAQASGPISSYFQMETVRQQIRQFKADNGVDRVMVLWTANTERYSKLVTKMSAETQFLYISHNKIAMEMAEQLIGVTMQEQGVSRIVAVDMEAAASLVEPA